MQASGGSATRLFVRKASRLCGNPSIMRHNSGITNPLSPQDLCESDQIPKRSRRQARECAAIGVSIIFYFCRTRPERPSWAVLIQAATSRDRKCGCSAHVGGFSAFHACSALALQVFPAFLAMSSGRFSAATAAVNLAKKGIACSWG